MELNELFIQDFSRDFEDLLALINIEVHYNTLSGLRVKLQHLLNNSVRLNHGDLGLVLLRSLALRFNGITVFADRVFEVTLLWQLDGALKRFSRLLNLIIIRQLNLRL